MCGLIGIIDKEGAELISPERKSETLQLGRTMLETLRYRGPDEEHLTHFGGAFLGHTRLSIIDLEGGSQPIYNEDRSVAVVLNGEIYNFPELRAALRNKGHQFRTRSDTEVIVHLYEEYGENVFSYLNGMFAAVIYDSARHVVLAGRDRMGEKPLLYHETQGQLFLASELKALLPVPSVDRKVDPDALSLYLNSMFVPSPSCIFQGVQKVPPAHYLKMERGKLTLKSYWAPQLSVNWSVNRQAVCEEFEALFDDAVKIRLVSDVPIGSFLSGGIDSSAVTAFMARNCNTPVRTFSVGFADEVDERPFARIVAEQYGTQHTELFVPDKMHEVLSDVVAYYDEPFADSSALPTYLISREARRHLKVILTGDGGDELFAGYGSYLDQKYQAGGRLATKAFKVLNRLSLRLLKKGVFEGSYPKGLKDGARQHWLAVRSFFHQDQIERLLGSPIEAPGVIYERNRWLEFESQDPLSQAFEHDVNYYLPDDLLKKVDMASMANSLECRAPFLDHRLVEFALKVPPTFKVEKDETKSILKKALKPFLPDSILNREKIGFGAPIASWLGGGLKELTLDSLGAGCYLENYLDRTGLDQCLDTFYRGKGHRQDFRVPHQLWILLMLELWMRNYLAPKRAA